MIVQILEIAEDSAWNGEKELVGKAVEITKLHSPDFNVTLIEGEVLWPDAPWNDFDIAVLVKEYKVLFK